MEYRVTDTNKATVTIDLTLGDVDDLRAMLQAAMDANIDGVSRWTARMMIGKLIEAQAQAAEIMVLDAKAIADKVAKLREAH